MGRRISNRDITERKLAEKSLQESEQKFRQLFQNIADPIFIADPLGKIIAANDQACIEMGYTLDDLLDRHTIDLDAVFNTPEKAASLWKELYRSGSVTFETAHQRKDGSEFPVEINARRIDISGRQCILGVARNLSERKRIEKERAHIEKQLQHAQKMEAIGTLAGGIAHDFNNILGAIIGYAEMVEEDSEPGSTVKNDIGQVLKASHRAKDLVKQILAFSRQDEIQRMPIQPEIIAEEITKMLRSTLPSTIVIRQNIQRETGFILADPSQLHQILMNLCTNAFHAMEEAGGVLSLALKKRLIAAQDIPIAELALIKAGSFIQMSVEDTGPGIPSDIKNKIFEPYFTTKEVGKGTGMGLSTVHGIVKSYGGFITCQSKIDQGTVFDVFLPSCEAPASQNVEPLDLPQFGNEHILFIDDEEILAEMSKHVLERLGYKVTVRHNSFDALTTFQNQPDAFDLVITDQTMPGLTGSDLARRMLQIRPGKPIILCTGYSSQISEEKALRYGIKGFALKPISRKDISVLIRKVLDPNKPH